MGDEDAILAHALDHGLVGNHAVGTCAIGPDQSDVTDPALRVRGTEGLRVVDASVFPAIPAGNTAAPTMAMAWLAARLIAEGAGPISSAMPEPLSVGGHR
jgi:choline dehydrogenase-like flavoprotein